MRLCRDCWLLTKNSFPLLPGQTAKLGVAPWLGLLNGVWAAVTCATAGPRLGRSGCVTYLFFFSLPLSRYR